MGDRTFSAGIKIRLFCAFATKIAKMTQLV